MGAEIHVVEKDQDPEEEETEVLKCLPAENKKTETCVFCFFYCLEN